MGIMGTLSPQRIAAMPDVEQNNSETKEHREVIFHLAEGVDCPADIVRINADKTLDLSLLPTEQHQPFLSPEEQGLKTVLLLDCLLAPEGTRPVGTWRLIT